MKFEVININGQVVMNTEYKACVPITEEIKTMSGAGYRFKVDGKFVALNKVNEAVGRTLSTASKMCTHKKQLF